MTDSEFKDWCATCDATVSNEDKVIILGATPGCEPVEVLHNSGLVHDVCWLARTPAEKKELLHERIKRSYYVPIYKDGSDRHFLGEEIKRMDRAAKANIRFRLLCGLQRLRFLEVMGGAT